MSTQLQNWERNEQDAQQRESMGRPAGHFRILTRAVRLMREGGASTKEIAHALRVIANELDGSNKPAVIRRVAPLTKPKDG